ncbi:hypothetical protein CRENBAI_016427 [Crenichthys baileyi]|uniref:Uncharacterized protein n=1 Tax=Crenichthys baileyi TaxID=28760 RepID=A0AAV9QUX7_9TELE
MFPLFFSLSSAVAFPFKVPRPFVSSFSYIFFELHLFFRVSLVIQVHTCRGRWMRKANGWIRINRVGGQRKRGQRRRMTIIRTRDEEGYKEVWVKEKVKEKENDDYNNHDDDQEGEVYKKGKKKEKDEDEHEHCKDGQDNVEGYQEEEVVEKKKREKNECEEGEHGRDDDRECKEE